MNILFFIFGMSGSGKDSIIEKVLEINPTLTKITPITSRPMRENEINGREYDFISKEEFLKMIDSNSLMEHRKYAVFNFDLFLPPITGF